MSESLGGGHARLPRPWRPVLALMIFQASKSLDLASVLPVKHTPPAEPGLASCERNSCGSIHSQICLAPKRNARISSPASRVSRLPNKTTSLRKARLLLHTCRVEALAPPPAPVGSPLANLLELSRDTLDTRDGRVTHCRAVSIEYEKLAVLLAREYAHVSNSSRATS